MIKFGDFMKTIADSQVVLAMNECGTWLFYDSKERYKGECGNMVISTVRIVDEEMGVTLLELEDTAND